MTMEVELINVDVPGSRIVLSDLPASIGRSQTADVCLNDPGVAEFQCLIVQDGDKLAVIDNAEDGGTFVNGVRAIWNSLRPGDNLRVGESDFLVQFWSKVMPDQVR
jgi:pSer/pThr/pTyr-binding forkhead associated (FHA) protein